MKKIVTLLKSATGFLLLLCLSSVYSYAQSGFQYLGSYDNQGVPSYIETQPDRIDTTFIADIEKALPEKKPVPQFHPHYIAGQVQTELRLKQEADIWVTFVSEGAGWKNALGFYSYTVGNPPKRVEDITTKTIIFPNVSAPSSGGALPAGSKVKIGHFQANTVIGWFIVADGWRNNMVSGGNYLLFSNSDFNPEITTSDRSHMVLLHDKTRNKLILGFEDTRRDQGSDQDFNDILFYVSAHPFTAIEKENIVILNPPSTPANQTDSTSHTPTNPSKPATQTPAGTTYNNTTNNTNNVITTHTAHTNHSNNTTNSNNNTTNSNNTTTTVINNNTIVVNQTNTNPRRGNNKAPSRNSPNNNSANTSGNANNNRHPSRNTSICAANGFSEKDFTKTHTLLLSKPNEDVRISTLKQAVRGRLLSIEQCTQLISVLSVSSYRLTMAKYLFDYTCEKNNYFMVSKVLTVAAHEREFNAFLASKNLEVGQSAPINQNTNAIPLTDETTFTDSEFESLINSVSRQSFSDTRMSIIKQALQNKHVTTKQTMELLQVMSFETDRLKLAKYLYDFTSDRQNYYKLHTVFSYSSTVDELNTYLKGK